MPNNTADTNTFIAHHNNSTHSSQNSLSDKGTSGCTPVLPAAGLSKIPVHNHVTPIGSPVVIIHFSRNITSVRISFDTRRVIYDFFLCTRCQTGTWRKNSPYSSPNGNQSSFLDNSALSSNGYSSFDVSLAQSPATPSQEAKSRLLRPKNLVERARLNVA